MAPARPGTVQTAPPSIDAIEGSQARLDELEAACGEVHGGERLRDFILRVSPRHPPPAHVEPIMRLVERSATRGGVRALVSMPPRCAKTTTILHGMAWLLARLPGDLNAYATYAQDLSRFQSRKARRLATAAGVRLADDAANVDGWMTRDGGGFLATSIGGPFTGKGVNGCLVIDDPTKDRQQAESSTYRETTWDWFTDVAYTRLEPGASCIVVATRWHEDDLIGRLAKDGGWKVINLPAFDEARGTALWPERFPVGALQDICAQVGEHTFSALYQGQPRSRGSRVFGPANRYEAHEFSLAGKRILIGVDPAASESTRADFSVAVVLAAEGYGAAMKAWVLDVVRVQATVPAFVQRLRDLQARYRGVPLAVESVGGFKAIPQMLRSVGAPMIREIRPLGDKFTRAQPVAAAWNDGRVLVPIGVPWADDFLAELDLFTGVKDKHDDCVDALGFSWNALASTPVPRPRDRINDFAPFG